MDPPGRGNNKLAPELQQVTTADSSIMEESMFTTVGVPSVNGAAAIINTSTSTDSGVSSDDESSKAGFEPSSSSSAAAAAAADVPRWRQRRYLFAALSFLLIVGVALIISAVIVHEVTNEVVGNESSSNESQEDSNEQVDPAPTAASSPSPTLTFLPSLRPSPSPTNSLLPLTSATLGPTDSMQPAHSFQPSSKSSSVPTSSVAPSASGSNTPTESPAPTASPTKSRAPSSAPIAPPEPTSLLPKTFGFYVMGDIPYAPWEEEMLQVQMANLHQDRFSNSHFMVHVGDMQKPDRTRCSEVRYATLSGYLRQGPLPTYSIAGDNDWIDCPNPEFSLQLFRKYFVDFQKHWVDPLPEDIERMDITYHPLFPEMFQFEYASVLFLSIHLLNTKEVETTDDWEARMQVNIDWVTSYVTNAAKPYRAVVMFGHALYSQDTRPFFEGIQPLFVGTPLHQTPVMYIHGDGHKWDVGVKVRDQLKWDHFIDIQVDQGAFADPIFVEIASSDETTLDVEHDLQYIFGQGMLRIDRQSGRYPDSMTGLNFGI